MLLAVCSILERNESSKLIQAIENFGLVNYVSVEIDHLVMKHIHEIQSTIEYFNKMNVTLKVDNLN
jgi:molybdenum cofactor biosynthesis enzyme MoaA